MSDLTDRFERLANRGTMRGGDAVLDAARREVDGAAVVRRIDERDDTFVGVPAIDPIELESAPTRRRRRFGAAIAAAGVAASLFVGALAIGSVVGSGSGSDSPAGAVRQLADAVSHEDPIAAAAVLSPDEVRSLSATVNAAERRAQTLALARSADAPLAGVDFSVDGLDLSTQSLGADYAKVTVAGGRFSTRTQLADLAPVVQQALRDSHDGSSEANLATLEESNHLPTFVMTVQRNGHWYVSAAYTLLEYIRELNDLPAADFGSGLRAEATLGADTATAAVTDALQALAKGDWGRLVALAPPDELPVYDYRAALEQLGAQSDYGGFTVDHVDPTATFDGDTAKVLLNASGHDSDGDRWSLNGGCWSLADANGNASLGTNDLCAADGLSIIPLTINEPGNGPAARFTVVRKDGRWFVSGVGTALDLVDHAIATVSERTIYSLMGVPERIPPDGTLSLGTTVTVPTGVVGDHVYTFAGRANEELLAVATPTDPRAEQEGFFAEVRVFGPDSRELEGAGGIVDGQPLRLPADGTYTFAVSSFAETRFTLYDLANAPAAATHPSEPSALGECQSPPLDAQICSGLSESKSSSATTSTVPVSVP